MQIREIVLSTFDIRGTKRVNEISIYTSNNWNAELSTIKQEKSAWTFIMTMKVTKGKGGKIKFPISITAWNLMFEFHIVNSNKPSTSSNEKSKGPYSNPYRNYEYESLNYGGYSNNVQSYSTFSVNNKKMLNCPRCSIIVDDSRGVCSTCRENTFQWAFCRNINYEHLGAFLWNECGLSRYAKYEFALLARPWIAIEKSKEQNNQNESRK